MSVRVPRGSLMKDEDHAFFYAYDPGDTCFLCRTFLSGPVVDYRGAFNLELHADCALNLILALSRDVSEIKRTHGLRPTMHPAERLSPPSLPHIPRS